MTPENDSFDELASAYLDGELSAPERAQVEADPAILARIQVFERVRHAVATQTGAPAETRRENALVAAVGPNAQAPEKESRLRGLLNRLRKSNSSRRQP